MKKKGKLFIVILFSLSLSAILTNTLGQTTYTCKVKIGDEFIDTITTLDAYTAILLNLSLGDKTKINITDITEETDYFTIEYDGWREISESESFGATADWQTNDDVYKNASDNNAQMFVLSPVSTYLAEYAAANLNASSSGNILTEIFPSYIQTLTYDSNGIVSKWQISNSTTVLYIRSRSGSSSSPSIPGYDLPIFIGLTVIASVSIIYILKKKNLK